MNKPCVLLLNELISTGFCDKRYFVENALFIISTAAVSSPELVL